jgi:DNA-directed RNA polymerase subunit RPC12/RpoP
MVNKNCKNCNRFSELLNEGYWCAHCGHRDIPKQRSRIPELIGIVGAIVVMYVML